jgi:hypothetical protein
MAAAVVCFEALRQRRAAATATPATPPPNDLLEHLRP